jgi:hypothetical protein
VGVENFHSVGERGPEVLKAAIEDVFKRVTVVLIQCHPGIFFSVVDRKMMMSFICSFRNKNECLPWIQERGRGCRVSKVSETGCRGPGKGGKYGGESLHAT